MTIRKLFSQQPPVTRVPATQIGRVTESMLLTADALETAPLTDRADVAVTNEGDRGMVTSLTLELDNIAV